MQKGTHWGVLGEGRGLLAFGWSAWASQEGGLGGKMRRTRVITQEHDWGRLLPGRVTSCANTLRREAVCVVLGQLGGPCGCSRVIGRHQIPAT